jgi:hypothetical protein
MPVEWIRARIIQLTTRPKPGQAEKQKTGPRPDDDRGPVFHRFIALPSMAGRLHVRIQGPDSREEEGDQKSSLTPNCMRR